MSSRHCAVQVFEPIDRALGASYAVTKRECEGCGRNDGSYNLVMPKGLLELLAIPANGRL